MWPNPSKIANVHRRYIDSRLQSGQITVGGTPLKRSTMVPVLSPGIWPNPNGGGGGGGHR